MSYFELTFNSSLDLESKFLKRVRFRINLFNTRQNLNRKNYKALDFEGKIFVENQQFLKSCSQKNNLFLSFYTVKATKLALSCFLASLDSDYFLWNGVHFLDQIFRAAWHFESSFWKHVRFWTMMFEHVVFWANILKIANTLIENLRTCHIIKFSGETCFQRIIFWVALKR